MHSHLTYLKQVKNNKAILLRIPSYNNYSWIEIAHYLGKRGAFNIFIAELVFTKNAL